MYDLTKFTLADMTRCGAHLRRLGSDAGSMEAVAKRLVAYLYEHFVSDATGEKQCALVRLFKTHSLGELDTALQQAAGKLLAGDEPSPNSKCLTLLATVGHKPQWNDRRKSAGHQAIPLPSPEAVGQIPMISQLIKQFGLEVSSVLEPNLELLVDLQHTTFNVFHVAQAAGSPYVPAQDEFVVPMGIKSVLGFGGMLPSGNIFAVIMFAVVEIPRATADQFESLALSVKLALMPFEQRVFTRNEP